jgi:acyl-CoA thioesterase-1
MKQAKKLPSEGGLVLIEIGGNDLLGTTTSADFDRDLESLLQRVCIPGRTVLMFELPLPPLMNEYGRVQRRLAARYDVKLIPKRVLMSVLAADGNTLDSIHLSPAGHQRMADNVWSIIEPATQPK